MSVFSVIGAIVALILALIKVYEWSHLYLTCSLSISRSDGCVIAETAVENTSIVRRKIDWAFLVISSQQGRENFLTRLNVATGENLRSTPDLIRLKRNENIEGDGVVLAPLPFFYLEQVGVRDERITFSKVLSAVGDEFNLGQGLYDVRFFVFPKSRRHGFHRCTHRVVAI